MTVLISPTKQMDFISAYPAAIRLTEPLFAEEAGRIITSLRQINRDSLADMMKMSSELTDRSVQMINSFGTGSNDRRPALFAYSGTVFQAAELSSMNMDQLIHANKHLRILSGLYGILRPFDAIEPYRLEMKTTLETGSLFRERPLSESFSNGKRDSLVSFWKARVTETLKTDSVVLNLASSEYAQVVNRTALNGTMLNVQFKERNAGTLRTVGTYSKMARGLMMRRILQGRITDPVHLQSTDIGGYRYRAELSDDSNWVFVRG